MNLMMVCCNSIVTYALQLLKLAISNVNDRYLARNSLGKIISSKFIQAQLTSKSHHSVFSH